MVTLDGTGLRALSWRRIRLPLVLAWLALGLVAVAVTAPGLLAGVSPTATDPVHGLSEPGGAHWFGTDQLGRDVYARVVYGARTSVLMGLGATTLAALAGAVLGLGAALGGRAADQVLMRFADILLGLPQLLLAMLVITVLGRGPVNITLAIAVAFTPAYARMARAEALVARRSGYVEAATALGLRRGVLVIRHIVPNALGPLLVLATVSFGTALIAASGLSFLGFGVRPPAPEWGAMLSEARDFLQTAWWLGLFPGVAVAGTVIAVNVAGRAAQQRFTKRSG
jgi:peptide/nickel transport system permease protein